MTFIYVTYKGGKSKRLYTATDKSEAQSFANLFSGYYWEFTPENWYVVV